MIRRVLTSACVLMGVLLLVIAWHLRDPDPPQTFLVVSRIDNQVTLYQAALGDADYWRRLTAPFELTQLDATTHPESVAMNLDITFSWENTDLVVVDDDKVALRADGSLLMLDTKQTIPIAFDFDPPPARWQWQWLPNPRLLMGHSPDGRLVAIQIDDGAVMWSHVNTQTLYISPNGEWLVYGTFDGSFYWMQSDGTAENIIAPIPEFYSIVAWSDDYILYKTHTPQSDRESLWRMNPDGSNRLLFTDTLQDIEFVTWSPNQTWLLLSSQNTTPLWAMHVSDGVIQRVGTPTQDHLEFLAWGPPLPKNYTYCIAAALTGLLFLVLPFIVITANRFMRNPELSTPSQIN